MAHGSSPSVVQRAALSAAQHRLWLAARVEPDSFEFTVPWAARVRGPLDTDALAAAWVAVLERHAELRLRVTDEGGEPGRAQWPVDLMLATVRTIPPEDVAETLRRAATRVFDLSAEPLAELEVLRLAENDHLLLLTAHHVVTDGRSVQLITGDLFGLYAGEAVAAAGASYVDYVAGERTSLQPVSQQVESWIEQLRLPVPERPLGLGAARPMQGKRGAVVRRAIDAPLWTQIQRAAREQRTTTQVVGMAALGLTLRRYTGSGDVVLGGTMDTRASAYADTVGMFVNPVPVRLRIDDDQPVADYLGSAHRALLRAFAFRHVPFDEVVRGVGSTLAAGRTPVFQVLFNYEGRHKHTSVPGLAISPVDFPVAVSKYDLTMWLRSDGETAELAAVYRADQYTDEEMAQFTEHMYRVLTAMVADPSATVGSPQIFTVAETAELLALGDGGPVAPGAEVAVSARFVDVAAAHLDQPAVIHAAENLDYRQLRDRSGVIAQRLAEQGVGAGAIVGVLTERSAAMVAAVLGVLRAGAAYLPLDPAHPDERIAAVLADAGAVSVLVTESTAERVGTIGVAVIQVDKEWGAPTQAVDVPVSRQDPAYLIYTSGTSGEPKGVVVEHGQLAASTAARRVVYPGAPVFLHVSPLAFDSSVAGLWGTLTAGGTLVVAGVDDVRDPERLLALVHRHQVTDLLCLPSLYDLVLSRADDGAALRSLRRVIVAGEAMPEALARKHFALAPQAELVNEYGPTEATVWASHHCYRRPGPVTIGGPIPGTRLYVVDDRGELAPRGTVGELHIGGAGVARGYHGRDGDTAHGFGTDRFALAPDARVYRTGDRVRWTSGGRLEFLGRADHQVKIRGHRVELGAVETALATLAGVRAAAVLPDAEATRLVGFVVADPGFDAPAARHRLAELLPEPMVPRTLITVDAFPCTPNGKLDRDALGVLALEPAQPTAEPATTGDDVVTQVCTAWSTILGVAPVPVEANFFDVGGHSLLVPALQMALTEATGMTVSIVDLFSATTVLAQADLVRAAGRPAPAPDPPAAPTEPVADDRRARMAARRAGAVTP